MLATQCGQSINTEAFNRFMGRMGTPEEIGYGVVSPSLRRIQLHDRNRTHHRTEAKLSGQWRLADTPYGMQAVIKFPSRMLYAVPVQYNHVHDPSKLDVSIGR